MALYHRKESVGNDVLLIETANGDSSSFVVAPSDSENKECIEFGRETRHAVRAKDDQDFHSQ